jgi:hypothetical protein
MLSLNYLAKARGWPDKANLTTFQTAKKNVDYFGIMTYHNELSIITEKICLYLSINAAIAGL